VARVAAWCVLISVLILGGASPAAAQVQASLGAVLQPWAGNPYNLELVVGGTGGVRIAHRHTVEAQVLVMPRAEHNQTDLAAAVTMLTDPNFKEMFDGEALVVARYRGSPFYGALPGTPVFVALDLFVGGGIYAGNIELGRVDYGTGSARVAQQFRSEPLPALNVGGGVRFFPLPWLGIRWELQAVIAFDQVLDFSTPEAARVHRNLPADATRLLCDGGNAGCTLGVETLTSLGFGFDFVLPEVAP